MLDEQATLQIQEGKIQEGLIQEGLIQEGLERP
jgi:hypothetical protein